MAEKNTLLPQPPLISVYKRGLRKARLKKKKSMQLKFNMNIPTSVGEKKKVHLCPNEAEKELEAKTKP